MKITVALLTLLVLFSLTTPAQESTHLNLPEGAVARLGKGSINAIQYSPDGTRLAVATSIGIWLYDTTTYQEVALFTGHTGSVLSMAFSPDGKFLASGGRDDTVRLWDIETDEITTLTGYRGWIYSVAFSPDGSALASGSEDKTVRLWETVTWHQKRMLTGYTSGVYNVAFRPRWQCARQWDSG